MTDNTILNTGSGGDTIATDDIGGIKFPRTKFVIGNDGTNDGDISSSNPMPMLFSPVTWNAPTFATVGVASGVVLAANSSRKGAILVNDSSTTIYLGIGAAAVVGSGIRLNPTGGSYEIDAENLTAQVINAISTAASRNMTVHEAV